MYTPSSPSHNLLERFRLWFDRNFIELGREMRLSYLPPLMVYVAAGISGLTAIVGTFFVKDYLGLSAEFLAGLAFWAMLPWTLKLPVGHLVDLIWRYKGGLVFLGASLIAASLLIMLGLLNDRVAMEAVLPTATWYVLSVLLAPVGYVIQDVVADAMTVEAVPTTDEMGLTIPESQQRLMHATMQTLGRVAIIAGTLIVALVNVFMFNGVEGLAEGEKVAIYQRLYQMALIIPVTSCFGVIFAWALKRKQKRNAACLGLHTGGNRQAHGSPYHLHRTQLVDSGRRTRVCPGQHHSGPRRSGIRAGDHLRPVHGHHSGADVPADG